jgi:hypothetical protein
MIQSDGTVEFESPKVTISAHSTRNDFLKSSLFALSKPLNQNAPWSRYSFQPVIAGGEHFAGDICFCSGPIYSISLCSVRPEFGSSWSDFSVEKERARHCFHKRLLRDIFKRPADEHTSRGPDERDADVGFSFPWGNVSAATDIKGGGCYVLIKYPG